MILPGTRPRAFRGIFRLSVITQPEPMMQSFPISTLREGWLHPINTFSPILEPWTMALWPMWLSLAAGQSARERCG